MTERERLIELLKHDSCQSSMLCDPNCQYANLQRCYEERTADYLLENGVILSPVKVGNTVYALWEIPTDERFIIYCAEVREIVISNQNCRLTTKFKIEPVQFRGRIKEYSSDDFGKIVFLTCNEAEEVLAKLKSDKS